MSVPLWLRSSCSDGAVLAIFPLPIQIVVMQWLVYLILVLMAWRRDDADPQALLARSTLALLLTVLAGVLSVPRHRLERDSGHTQYRNPDLYACNGVLAIERHNMMVSSCVKMELTDSRTHPCSLCGRTMLQGSSPIDGYHTGETTTARRRGEWVCESEWLILLRGSQSKTRSILKTAIRLCV